MSKHQKFSIRAKQTLGRKTTKAKAKLVTEDNQNEDYDNEEDEEGKEELDSMDAVSIFYLS